MYYINATYAARLRAQEEFVCENCGNCCTQCAPIDVTKEDLERIAKHFNKTPAVAARRHCKPNPINRNILAIKHDVPCKFYKKGRCSIYEARPEVCRNHPFLSGEHPESARFIVPSHCLGAIKVYEKMKERGEIG